MLVASSGAFHTLGTQPNISILSAEFQEISRYKDQFPSDYAATGQGVGVGGPARPSG